MVGMDGMVYQLSISIEYMEYQLVVWVADVGWSVYGEVEGTSVWGCTGGLMYEQRPAHKNETKDKHAVEINAPAVKERKSNKLNGLD